MKKILKNIATMIMLLFLGATASAQTPSADQNYIMETLVKHQGHKTSGSLSGLPVDSANRNIRYIDGIGRPLQTVQWQGSPGKKDIVSYNVYDAVGREAVKYLPYAEQTGSDASYKSAAATNQANFYGGGSWDANVAKTPYAYSRTVFEASPLNRVLEQGAPGAVWQPYSGSISGSGHSVKMEQGTNGTGEVALWKVSGSGAATSTSYASGTLSKTISRDENWTSGKAGTTAEFKDMLGRVVLRRQWSSSSDSLSTYYIYDVYSNLRYVVPPAVTATSFTETSDSNFTNFIYAYHYDGRKRVIEKKIPGKGWEHIVYNRLDQMVLTQDSVMRADSKWWFTKYDALGRVIVTGIITSSSDRATWQSSIGSQSYLWETRDNANSNLTDMGYTNLSLPTGGFYNYYTINYYDDYDFLGNPFGQPVSPQVDTERTKGLLTGTRSLIIGDGAMPYTVNYYDEEGRVVTAKSQNHLGGTDVVENTYNFADELTASTRTHVDGSSNTTTIASSFTYDHVGRKLSTKENINSQGDVWLNKMEYNGIGQLKQKNLHSTNGSTFMQNTKLSYNERGWLKGSTSAEFSMKLGYDTLSNPQYNGNISTQLWGSGSSFPNRFDYSYDRLNRLTNGTSTGISMGEVLSYDVMGNIATMNRDGAGTATYSYTGNRLTGISGGGLTTGSYAYDGNGNATTDGRLGATFAYNFLNLPVSITKIGLNLAYVYDGMGKKLQKVNSTTSTTTDYVDGIQYTNGTIDFIQTEEGRALNSSGTYSYQYDLKDHLGNVRYSFDIYGGAVRKLQQDDYYAFGLRHSVTGGTNNYLYNGKELQDELGQYDYGARFYDPVVGRFGTIDPLAEKDRRWSSYSYGHNNPITHVDVDGMFDWVKDNDGNIKWDENAKSQATTKSGETYLGGTVVEFKGSRSEKLGTKDGKEGYINGEGAITATVKVYGSEGANDIQTFTGYTMTSDPIKFGAIDEGLYNGNYDEAGKSGSLKSNWAVEERGAVRMMDGKINPNAPNQVDANGEGYKTGIFIHSSNNSGYAGTIEGGASGISVGCLLIAPSDWKGFNDAMSGVTNFKIQVTRTVSIGNPFQGQQMQKREKTN